MRAMSPLDLDRPDIRPVSLGNAVWRLVVRCGDW
jgi:hypothetical protein